MKKFNSKYKKRLAVIILITGMLLGATMPLPKCYSQIKIVPNHDTAKVPGTMQNIKTQIKCGKMSVDPAALKNARNYEAAHANSLLGVSNLVRVYFHIFRDDDGSNPAALESDIESEFNQLVSDYSSHGICFVNLGFNYINNTVQNNFFTPNNITGPFFIEPYCAGSCINIFYHQNLIGGAGGTAYFIPNYYCSIEKSKIGGTTISHEVGHCLGLAHTHETADGAECIDGSNSLTAGDQMPDTPADPDRDNDCFTSYDCGYHGTCSDPHGETTYAPPYNNMMSYWCNRTEFTFWQDVRMNTNLNSPLFPAYYCNTFFNDLTLSSDATHSSGYTFYVAKNTVTTTGNIIFEGSSIGGISAEEVILKPGFRAAPSTGHFLIRTYSCGSSETRNASVVNSDINSNANQKSLNGSAAKNASKAQPDMISKGNQIKLICYPNPFSSMINLSYTSNSTGNLRIDIMDTQGKIVKSVVEQVSVKGITKKMALNPGNIPSGVYFLKVTDGTNSSVQKIIKL